VAIKSLTGTPDTELEHAKPDDDLSDVRSVEHFH
jgi:hypothetical protein